MRLIFLLILLIGFLNIQAQDKKVEFAGSQKGLERLVMNSVGKDTIGNSQYYLAILKINAASQLKSVQVIGFTSNEFLSSLHKALEGTSGQWKNNTGKAQSVLIPVYLVKDRYDETGVKETLPRLSYRQSLKEEYQFLPDVRITFYPPISKN